MRVATEKIKAAILHTDLVARSEAVLYFTSPITQDTSVMDLVIQAIEKFGIDEAFKDYSFCVNLAQTMTSLRWILRHESTFAFPRSLRRDLLLHVPPQLLADLAEDVRNPKFLSANGRECVARHIALLEEPAEALWSELKKELARMQDDSTPGVNDSDDEFEDSLVEEEASSSVDGDEIYDDEDGSFEDMEFSRDTQIFFALAVHPHVPEELILEGLAEDPDEQLFNDDGLEVEDNLLGYAVELAGRRRVEAAVPRFFELIKLCDGDEELVFFQEKCCNSLSQIGSDPVVRQLASVFPNFSLDTKLEALWILENNPTAESVRTTLELFATETDLAIRCKLLSAALRNFETSAIPLARELILGNERRPELLETRQDLLTCCDISGEQIPELEEWRADSANDAEYARQWYRDHYDGSRSELGSSWDDASGETEFNDDDEPAEFDESLMLSPKRPHIGRNDPCPCGSGKKFKKCCYGKTDFRPEN